MLIFRRILFIRDGHAQAFLAILGTVIFRRARCDDEKATHNIIIALMTRADSSRWKSTGTLH